MLYREIGKTGEKVSIMGFGCMRLPIIGDNVEHIDEEQATAMIEYAIENGVNYFDTAFPYHAAVRDNGGTSETFVGRALKHHRNNIHLATKLPCWLIKDRSDMDRYLDLQLEKLQTDRIDFYLLHCLNSEKWHNLKKNDVFNFLESAKADGRIRYGGFSFHDELPVFKEIIDAYDWPFCQIQYNYMDQNYQAGREGLNYAADKGVGVIVMEPLRGGALANVVPDEVKDVWSRADIERSPVEWAMRFLWNDPKVNLVLSGVSAMEHVVENVRIANEAHENSLTEKELELIEEVRAIYKKQSRVDCTACQYCMPCPAGVNIPVNFSYLNNMAIYKNNGYARYQYSTFTVPAQRASQCIECGKCESACPQNIPIREALKEVVAELGA